MIDLEGISLIDQLAEVTLLFLLFLDPLIKFLEVGKQRLLLLMLLFGTHEELLIVALAFDLGLIAESRLLQERMLQLASGLEDSSRHRVVAVLDLIDCALLNGEADLLLLCFGVSLALRRRESEPVRDDNEAETELLAEIEQVVCLSLTPVSVDSQTAGLKVDDFGDLLEFLVGVANDLDFAIEARKRVGLLALFGLGPVVKGQAITSSRILEAIPDPLVN